MSSVALRRYSRTMQTTNGPHANFTSNAYAVAARALRQAASDVFDTTMPAEFARWLEARADSIERLHATGTIDHALDCTHSCDHFDGSHDPRCTHSCDRDARTVSSPDGFAYDVPATAPSAPVPADETPDGVRTLRQFLCALTGHRQPKTSDIPRNPDGSFGWARCTRCRVVL